MPKNKKIPIAVPKISKEREEKRKWLNQQFRDHMSGEYVRRGLYNTPIGLYPKNNYPA